MKKLNKDSSVALYQQLINEIKESIQAGELKSGDRLMTEGEFSKEYDVSRITVRKAFGRRGNPDQKTGNRNFCS